MAEPLEVLAASARREPFFLAWVLAAYTRAERLDEAGLAEALGCDRKDLPMLHLCRAPRSDPEGFRRDPARLADVVKRGRVIARLQASAETAGEPGFLMAARDREQDPPEDAS